MSNTESAAATKSTAATESSRRVPAAHGEYTTHGVPHGYTSLTPHLAVEGAQKALQFYSDVFGAEILEVTPMGDLVAHAVLQFPSGRITVSDPMNAYGLVAPNPDAASVTLALYVTDVDEVLRRAVGAGAQVREPLSTFVSGDRYVSLVDPFSVRWTLMTRVEDLSPEESARRVREWANAQK